MLALAWTLARRELRGSLKGFGIFLACLALGVAVIAAVGSLSAAVDAGLNTDARALLGGDVEFHLAQRAANAEERRFLAASGAVSEVTRLRAMAVSADGKSRSLIELKAIDRTYPLYGTTTLSPAQDLDTALKESNGVWGAVAAQSLLDRLGLKLGDTIRIGEGRFVLRAVLAHEPDSVSGGFELGPRVMVADGALASTGLIVPGTLIEHAYRVRLPQGADLHAFIAAARERFPEAGWRIRSFADAAPNLQQLLDRLTVFLTLVGLTALLVGGVGIGNAVESYLREKIATIATLKCLGAPLRLVFTTYLLQILLLSLAGIGLGVVLGALAPYAAAPFLPSVLPVEARIALYPIPLLLATAYGLLATLAFASWPIGTACQVRAASLFRSLVEPVRGRPGLLPALIAGMAGRGARRLGTCDRVGPGGRGLVRPRRRRSPRRISPRRLGDHARGSAGRDGRASRACGWRSPIFTGRARRRRASSPRSASALPCWWRSRSSHGNLMHELDEQRAAARAVLLLHRHSAESDRGLRPTAGRR